MSEQSSLPEDQTSLSAVMAWLRHRCAVRSAMCERDPMEGRALVHIESLIREREELKRDLARYENGRVVMTAEIEALREKLREAQQLAMRQANQIRKLEKTIDNLNDVIIEEGL